MIRMLSDKDPAVLEDLLNGLGPDATVLSVYAINQLHFAWVSTPKPKAKIKELKHEK